MTTRYLYYNGLTGPLAYADTLQYPDGKFVEGARLSQAVMDADPTEYYHVVRLSFLDSTTTSLSTVISVAQSEVDAFEGDLSTAESVCESRDTSLSILVSVAQSTADVADNDSVARSMALSNSVIISSNLVTGDSKAVSLSTLTSTADSKAVSVGVLDSQTLSTANSHASSLSILTSVVQSTADALVLLASGSITRDNMKISAVDGTAFVDFSAADVLTGFVVGGGLYKLSIYDSALKAIIGYIKAAGTGETLDSDLFDATVGTFEGAGGGTTGHWTAYGNNTVIAEDQGGGDYALKITYVDNDNGAYLYFSDAYDLSANLVIGTCYKLVFSEKISGTIISVQGNNGSAYLDWGAYTNTDFASQSKYFTALNATSCRIKLAGINAGEVFWFDNLSLQKVLTPSATGVTIVSTKGGTTYNWASKETGFNYYDVSGYTYEIERI